MLGSAFCAQVGSFAKMQACTWARLLKGERGKECLTNPFVASIENNKTRFPMKGNLVLLFVATPARCPNQLFD